MKVSVIGGFAVMFGIAVLGVQAQEGVKERVINGGMLNGKAVSLPKPEYPAMAREQGKGGTVTVEVVIDESGLVVSATGSAAVKTRAGAEGMRAEKEDVDPSLIEAAENAARMARFSPTMLSGVPVRVKGAIFYNFVPGKGDGYDADDSRVKGGVLNSKAVSMPLPVYPPAARAVRAEGSVSVQVTIDEDGKVIEASAVSGHPLLRAAAVKSALDARFSPTLLEGRPVQVSGVLVYNFVGPEKSDQ